MKNGKHPVVDADSHVFEPAAIWETYLDPAYRVPARSAFYYHEDEFAAGVILNGRPASLMHSGRLNRSAIWRPGMTPEEQHRTQLQMRDWYSLTPEQRELVREKYKTIKKLPPEKRHEIKQKWREYGQTSQDQRGD